MSQLENFMDTLGILALGSRLRRLSDRIVAEGSALYSAHGINNFEPRWMPLYQLLLAYETVTVSGAAERLGVSHAAVSQVADAMIAGGLVAASRDERDGRQRHIQLTAEGKALQERLAPLWEDIVIALRDAAGGVDVMNLLGSIEQALAARSLQERVASARLGRSGTVAVEAYQAKWAPAFEQLNIAWLEKYFYVEPVDKEVLSDPEGAILGPGGAIFFAVLNGKAVGTCALIKVSDDVYELSKMAVDETCQGCGIGKRLMVAAIDEARRRRAEKVMLVTNSKLKPAVAMYHKFNFVVTHSGPHPKYERGDLVMEMRLR